MSLGRKQPRRKGSPAAGITVAVVAVLLAGVVIYLGWRLISAYTGDLRASRGNVTVVPKVEGLEETAASKLLEGARLKPLEPIRENHDTVPKGHVFRQDPAAGERVRPGKPVTIYISLGPARFIVPELRGMQLTEVTEVLSRAGLILGTVTKLYDPEGADGLIVNQNPVSGTEFGSPAAVDLYVTASSNLPEISMPQLSGMLLKDAESLLAAPDANLHLSLVEYVVNDAVQPGTVVEQNLEAGRMVRLGSRVELKVGIPAQLMLLPVRRLTLSLTVPLGPPEQQVKIKVYDKLGEKVDYENTHMPGDLLQRSIDVEGPAKVLVFIGDMKTPFREERL
ncbi:PASTA domain-containing protein [bacterium]|nr:PASTA domain-containing protein [bacterium]